MNRMIYADSERCADMLYATGFHAPDPFLYFEKNGRRHVVLNQLEYDRGGKEAKVDRVLNQTALVQEMQRRGHSTVRTHEWILELFRRHRVRELRVGPAFPLALADALRQGRIRLTVAEDGLFPERGAKTPTEVEAIRRSLRVTAKLLDHAIGMIRTSRPNRRGVLLLGGATLTSERIQAAIRTEAARCAFFPSQPIVSSGRQACDPHECGHGPLRANEFIIVDIFPRNLASGYWGDMTRTVVKGRANDRQRHQFETVRRAQHLAISKLRHGVEGRTIHRAVDRFFARHGYLTGTTSGRYEGFFHGTGHGLGLEIHESPRISSVPQILKTGNVVTIEPGLYYAATGGVRIEDVALIRRGGCEMLSRLPVCLEI